MLVSVVIPARNAARTLGECVLAVLSQTMPRELYEVILVDDGSTDSTAVIARRLGARVVPQPPFGIAAARNTGARAAKGEIIVFVDPDCVPKIDWLAQMVAPLQDSDVAGVAGAYESDQRGLLPRMIQAEYEDAYRQREGPKGTDVVEGFSAAYRRAAFVAVGGFDPAFAVADDFELSCRLRKLGKRLVFAPKAVVYHRHGTTLGAYVERSARGGLWRSLVYARHPDRLLADPTPAAQRSQVPLAGLALASLLLGTRRPAGLKLGGLFLAAFASTTIPSAWRLRRAGADVALASPGLAFARSAAASVGATVGTLAVALQRVHRLLR